MDNRAGQGGIRLRGLQGFFEDQLAQAPHTAWVLREASLVSGPLVTKDWSYTSKQFVGEGYILTGDAACFVDPLFSSGVHLALMSGVLAAAYVTTALKDDAIRQAAAKVYEELYRREYNHFRELAKLFYSSNRTADSYFWEARRLLEPEGQLSPRHAFIRAVAGQPARGYERVVLEHGEPAEEFAVGVRAVESDRTRRRARLASARSSGTTASWLNHVVPELAPEVRLERKPVLAEGDCRPSAIMGHI